MQIMMVYLTQKTIIRTTQIEANKLGLNRRQEILKKIVGVITLLVSLRVVY